MTSRSHDTLRDYLFPGDGLEAAAILICNQGTGRLGQRFLVEKIICPPYEDCDRRPDAVFWPVAETVSPDLITELDRRNQSIFTIHSHPEGYAYFSSIDDKNDRPLLASISGWFDDERPHGTSVMQVGGEIKARTVDQAGTFAPIKTVAVVGEEIKCWKQREGGRTNPRESRIEQTFGRGTLGLLKGMRVGVVGCSGTGSILIELLVRNAIGELVLVDDDKIEAVNLNRIVNSSAEDAKRRRPKVEAIKDAIDRIGLGTIVHPFEGSTDSAEIVRALVDCDVIFGCVDTAFGRYHLDCIASAYLIPYFDVGVELDSDGEGGIHSADAVAHYVQPEGSSLLSRGAYTMEQVTAELWRRTDSAHYHRQRIAGYLAAIGEEQPAVMSVNMQASCLSFNDFLARISGFRLDADAGFNIQRFRLVHGSFETDAAAGEPHPLLQPYIASGDRSLLVRNNIAIP